MAKQQIVSYKITDDLTGEEIPEDEATTIEFTYGGTSYSIDLNKKNAKKLDDFLAPYIDAASKVGRKSASSSSAPKKTYRPGVRMWAESNDLIKRGGKGRLPNSVLEAWDAAHS